MQTWGIHALQTTVSTLSICMFRVLTVLMRNFLIFPNRCFHFETHEHADLDCSMRIHLIFSADTLYYCDFASDSIVAMTLDGHQPRTIYTDWMAQIAHIAVGNGYLYYSATDRE